MGIRGLWSVTTVKWPSEEMALLDGPCNCQAFQLNDSISAFCIGEESRPGLHHPPVRVVVGWLLEKEEAQTEGASICVKAGLLGGVKVGVQWSAIA